MRAGRLISLLLILERRGRVTGADLARELEVSERTVLRDIESLSGAGVPVYATRGPGGGFQLLDGFTSGLLDDSRVRRASATRAAADRRRGRIRVSPDGRRVAALLGRLQPLRVRRAADADGWVEATFRLHSIDAAAADVLSLSPEVEVLEPPDLRDEVRRRLDGAAAMYD